MKKWLHYWERVCIFMFWFGFKSMNEIKPSKNQIVLWGKGVGGKSAADNQACSHRQLFIYQHSSSCSVDSSSVPSVHKEMRRFVGDLHLTSLFIKINNSIIWSNDICLCENGKLSFLEWGKKTVFVDLTIKKTVTQTLQSNPCISVIDCRRRQETVEIRERREACKYVLSWSHAWSLHYVVSTPTLWPSWHWPMWSNFGLWTATSLVSFRSLQMS